METVTINVKLIISIHNKFNNTILSITFNDIINNNNLIVSMQVILQLIIIIHILNSYILLL